MAAIEDLAEPSDDGELRARHFVSTLAETVNVDLADLRVVLASMEVEEITPDVITAVHLYLNPNRERTVPELYVPGVEPGWRED